MNGMEPEHEEITTRITPLTDGDEITIDGMPEYRVTVSGNSNLHDNEVALVRNATGWNHFTCTRYSYQKSGVRVDTWQKQPKISVPVGDGSPKHTVTVAMGVSDGTRSWDITNSGFGTPGHQINVKGTDYSDGQYKITGTSTGRLNVEKADHANIVVQPSDIDPAVWHVGLEGAEDTICALHSAIDVAERRLLHKIKPGMWHLMKVEEGGQLRKWIHESASGADVTKALAHTGDCGKTKDKCESKFGVKPNMTNFDKFYKEITDYPTAPPAAVGDLSDLGFGPDMMAAMTEGWECDECRGTGFVTLFTSRSPCSRGCRL